jgi:dihydrofolate reductase
MPIVLIAAMDAGRLIGDQDRLPWRLSADLRRFRRLTLGKPVIMGRKTFQAIGRPLDGRTNIVLSRRAGFEAAGCVVVPDLDAALAEVGEGVEVMVIGGAEIYALALPRAERMELTLLEGRFDGDRYFPSYDPALWREVARERIADDPRAPCAYSFVTLERARGA